MTKKEKFYYQQGKKFIHSSFLLTLSESKDEKEKTETGANTCTVSVLRQDGAATSGILCIWQ